MSEQDTIWVCSECEDIVHVRSRNGICEYCTARGKKETVMKPYVPKTEPNKLRSLIQDALDDYDNPDKCVDVAPGWVFVARAALTNGER